MVVATIVSKSIEIATKILGEVTVRKILETTWEQL
jgi:hypothetical protein